MSSNVDKYNMSSNVDKYHVSTFIDSTGQMPEDTYGQSVIRASPQGMPYAALRTAPAIGPLRHEGAFACPGTDFFFLVRQQTDSTIRRLKNP